MYSCGSLAPKMGRGGGGCSDCRFRRPPQLWERADGWVLVKLDWAEFMFDTVFHIHRVTSSNSPLCSLISVTILLFKFIFFSAGYSSAQFFSCISGLSYFLNYLSHRHSYFSFFFIFSCIVLTYPYHLILVRWFQ